MNEMFYDTKYCKDKSHVHVLRIAKNSVQVGSCLFYGSAERIKENKRILFTITCQQVHPLPRIFSCNVNN